MIKIGTIGTSAISEEFVESSKQQELGQVVACYSRELEKANEFIKKMELNAKGYDSLEEIAQDIDAVYIASPNGLHYQQAKFFLERKVNVFVEKPITFTLPELEDLINIAEVNEVVLLEAYKGYHLPQFRPLQHTVEMGQPKVATLIMNQYSSRMGDIKNGIYNSVFDDKLGKGSTYDMLVYPVGLAVGLFGKVKESKSFTSRLSNESGITNIVILEHENGMLTNITCSKQSHQTVDSEICFDDMNITIGQITKLENVVIRNFVKRIAPVRIDNVEQKDPFYYETKAFLEMVSNQDFKRMKKYLEMNKQTIKVLENTEMGN
ncbi:Gfo/Idh/MocA family protein [[Acholeplasma] multilocale]|uniref:Gfo/Idh/MocA family protein n=1 Tax=[Acholeplasma] multilocale TaxID=264638 RepID=UPI0004020008|nr:Gfo/Idh/MocA family oxidoreductase [[Acholeplasma] multilocale]